MPETAPPWVPADVAEAECRLNDRLLYRLEQRRRADLTAIEAAAVVESLRSIADGLEESCLDRTAGEVLAEVDVAITVEGDRPTNGR